jgi:hypothetical protein
MLKNLSEAIFANFRIKLLALAISLGIWFYASSQLLQEAPFTASLTILPPHGYALVYQSEQNARLSIEGPRSLMDTLHAEMMGGTLPMRYQMAQSDVHEGWASLNLQASWLQLGLRQYQMVQLRALNFQPASLRVFVSPIEEKTLPVKVSLAGQPPPGLRVQGQPATAPSKVSVQGPAVALDAMSSIPTEEVPLWQLTPGVFEEPRVLRRDVQVTLDNGQRVDVPLTLTDTTVLVQMRVIGQTLAQQTYSELPLNLLLPLQFPFQARVEAGEQTISVTVIAAPDELKKLGAGNIRAYLDLTGLAGEQIAPGASGPYREPVVVRLPPGVNVSSVRTSPQRVTVLLKNPAK